MGKNQNAWGQKLHPVFVLGAQAFKETIKALDSLGPYVKDDVQVRDTVLESLMSDANPGVRIEALHLLVPVRGDSSVRIVLERLAAKDENRYIRSQARTLIGQMPEMN